MKTTEQYSVNDGEYIDNSVYECIQYMIEDDIPKEHIVGYKLVILELEKCIDDKTIMLMRNTLYDRCEDRFDDGDWLDNKLDKIWSQFEDLEMFYDSGKYYTITEEDYEEVFEEVTGRKFNDDCDIVFPITETLGAETLFED